VQWPADKVERRPISSLIPYARNARTHSKDQIAQIAASMRQWGWTNPVLCDEGGMIIAGHGRVLAAQSLGWAEVPVMVASGWTDAQKRAYVIADNRLALDAGWDEQLLAFELDELRDAEFDLKTLGFEPAELNDLIGTPNTGPDAGSSSESGDESPVPDVPDVPVSRRGDIWNLGSHRVMTGDCRDAADVSRLLAGRAINLAFTSPPYADRRKYDEDSGFLPIHPDQYVEWFRPVAANVAGALADDGSWFVNIKPSAEGLDTSLYVFDLVIAHVREWGWHFATEFCWERNGVPKSVTQRFKNQFEPIYQFVLGRWKMRPDSVRHESQNVPRPGGPGVGDASWGENQGGNGAFFGGAKKRKHGTSKLMCDVQGKNAAPGEYIGPGLAYPGNRLPTFAGSRDATGHAAAFPVGLPEFFIKAFSDSGDLIFDPFMGSGSTLIAAEKQSRICCGMEISPAYVDVIVQRWQTFTGKQATLDGDGRTFEEVKRERSQAEPDTDGGGRGTDAAVVADTAAETAVA